MGMWDVGDGLSQTIYYWHIETVYFASNGTKTAVVHSRQLQNWLGMVGRAFVFDENFETTFECAPKSVPSFYCIFICFVWIQKVYCHADRAFWLFFIWFIFPQAYHSSLDFMIRNKRNFNIGEFVCRFYGFELEYLSKTALNCRQRGNAHAFYITSNYVMKYWNTENLCRLYTI